MIGWVDEGWGGVRRLTVGVVALSVTTGLMAADAPQPLLVDARLRQAVDSAATARAVQAAARRFGDSRCQTLLTDYSDRAGRPLRAALDAEGSTAPEFLGRLSFEEGTAHYCRGRRLAYTTPGSRIIFVCSAEFRKVSQQNSAYIEAAIIHEALHALGLGENPPTSAQITARVLDACRH
jgi:hypothetical protein